LDVARDVGALAELEAASQQPLIAASIAHRAVIEQRAIAMLGDDVNASLSEIFPQLVSPDRRSAFATGLHRGSRSGAAESRLTTASGRCAVRD
jgi:hypothetical protein